MNNKNNTSFDSFMEFVYMFAFFAMLIFAMVGCGSENVMSPDMMVNPDAGVEDMAVVEADADTDSDVILDDAGVDADADMGTMEDLGTEDSGMAMTDSGVTPDLGNEPDAGQVEDLYLVWIPENIPTGSQTVAVLNAACDELGGVVFDSPWVSDQWASDLVSGLRPFDDAACDSLDFTNNTCMVYYDSANDHCVEFGSVYGGYSQCMVSDADDVVPYRDCVASTACQVEEVARSNGYVTAAYWANGSTTRSTSNVGSVRNIICVLPESAVTAEFGMDYEFAILYTGAAQ